MYVFSDTFWSQKVLVWHCKHVRTCDIVSTFDPYTYSRSTNAIAPNIAMLYMYVHVYLHLRHGEFDILSPYYTWTRVYIHVELVRAYFKTRVHLERLL